jgi:hypothetical protein
METSRIDSLMRMYPGLISQYDVENGKLKESLELVLQREEAEKRRGLLALQTEVDRGMAGLDTTKEQIVQSTAERDKWEGQRESLANAMPDIMNLETDWKAALIGRDTGSLSGSGLEKVFAELERRRQKLNETYGLSYEPSMFAEGTAEHYANGELERYISAMEAEQALIDKLTGELNSLYSARETLMLNDFAQTYEGDLYGDLGLYKSGKFLEEERERLKKLKEEAEAAGYVPESLIEAYQLANDKLWQFNYDYPALAEKLNPVLWKIQDLRKEIGLLPDSKLVKIQVEYEKYAPRPSLGRFFTSGYGHESGLTHAEGGILTHPQLGLVGEAGPEAIIPLSSGKRGRALDLFRKTGSILGEETVSFPGTSSPVSFGDINVENHFTVEAETNATPESIMATIQQNIRRISGSVTHEITKGVRQSYENMPTGG